MEHTNSAIAGISVIKKVTTTSSRPDPSTGIELLYTLENPTANQKALYAAIDKSNIVICVGDSGTGKTLATTLKAVERLKNKTTRRVYIIRPELALKDGHSSLRSCYGYLVNILGEGKVDELLDREKIIPLTVQEARTINFKNAFVIFDEAHLATKYEFYLVISRLGKGSKMVALGDLIPLPTDNTYRATGLAHITKRVLCSNLPHEVISYVLFEKGQTVRSPVLESVLSTLFD